MPFMLALPDDGRSCVESILISVVFPAPFFPMSEKMPFKLKLNETPLSAIFPAAYVLEMPETLMSMGMDVKAL